MTRLYGLCVGWLGECPTSPSISALHELWRSPPTDEQLQQAIEDWVLQLHHSATPVKIRLIKVNNHELKD